jgi:hypothetical protein
MNNDDGKVYWLNAIGTDIRHSRINNEFEGVETNKIQYNDYTNHSKEQLKIKLPNGKILTESVYARLVVDNRIVPNIFYYIKDINGIPQLYQLYHRRIGKFRGKANSSVYQPILIQLTHFKEQRGAIRFNWMNRLKQGETVITYALKPGHSFNFNQENNHKFPLKVKLEIDKPKWIDSQENLMVVVINGVPCPIVLSKESSNSSGLEEFYPRQLKESQN